MQYSISGLGPATINYNEYAGPNMLNLYNTAVSNLNQAYQSIQLNIQEGKTPLPSDYDTIVANLQTLSSLAQNGTQDLNGTQPYTSYMNQQMALTLSNVTGTLAAIGITSSSPTSSNLISDTSKSNLLQNWYNLGNYQIDVQGALTNALNISNSNYTTTILNEGTGLQQQLDVQNHASQTLQSVLELDYIQTGNTMMAGHLSSLSAALLTSQNALNSLQVVENISNQITVSATQPAFQFPPTSDASISISEYNMLTAAESNYSYNYTNQLAAGVANPNNSSQAFSDAFNAFYKQATPDAQSVYRSFFINAVPMVFFPPSYDKFLSSSLVAQLLGIHASALLAGATLSYASYGGTNHTFYNLIASDAKDISHFKNLYKIFASGYFSQIFPTATPLQSSAALLLATKQDLLNEIAQIEQQGSTGALRNVPGSLANTIYTVVQDISAAFSQVALATSPQQQQQYMQAAIEQWIIDNQDQPASSFTDSTSSFTPIQSHIQAALTAAENLEEKQREDVRTYLYVFQEFYKSAATMLLLMLQMFQKISQGIGKQQTL